MNNIYYTIIKVNANIYNIYTNTVQHIQIRMKNA